METPANNSSSIALGHEPPLFSVLVPSYNQASYLPLALESLLDQQYPHWEAVVVNDGSTDDTARVAESFAQRDRRVFVYHKENGGCGSALNMALKKAHGEWICWLSTDDLFLPEKLNIHLEGVRQHPNTLAFHSAFKVLDEFQKRTFLSGVDIPVDYPPNELRVLQFFQKNYINGISICISRKVFEAIGPFMEHFRNAQDFDMWLRMSEHFPHLFLPQHTCVSRVHPGSGTCQAGFFGLFDSGWSCADYLNAHPFADLFPSLDLDKKENVMLALEQVIKVLVNQHAYINIVGCGRMLIERLREWCAKQRNLVLRQLIRDFFIQTNEILQKTLMSEAQKTFVEWSSNFMQPYQYTYHWPMDLLAKHYQWLNTSHNPQFIEQAEFLYKYMSRMKQLIPPDQGPFSHLSCAFV